MPRAFVSFGSNIRPAQNVRAALRCLNQSFSPIALSTIYRTPAEGRPDQPPYLNGVVAFESSRPPIEIRERLRAIENSLHRERAADKFAPRTIDLDLLLYGDLALSTPDLTLPDPQIMRRAFVAHPLHELAPNLVLPAPRIAIAHIAASLPTQGMEPLDRYTALLRRELARRAAPAPPRNGQ